MMCYKNSAIFMERDLSAGLNGDCANYEEHVQLAKAARHSIWCSRWCRKVYKRGTGTLYTCLAVVMTCHKAWSAAPARETSPGTAEVLTKSEIPQKDAGPGH